MSRICSNCDATMSARGPQSETGLYFCSLPDCQAAKRRDWYSRSTGRALRQDAPTLCSHCGADLQPRKIRHGDIPGMRWCQKTKCQNNRRAMQLRAQRQGNRDLALEAKAASADFLYRFFVADKTGKCPNEDCNLEGIIPGYAHTNEFGDICPSFEDGFYLHETIQRKCWPMRLPAVREVVVP